jgi:transposase
MPKFKHYDYNQSAMVVINYEEQLQPGTFEHAIHYLIDNKLDLSVYYPHYSNDDGGRPAYDPAILLKIILFAYSKGMTSSRQIQWCCQTNIIFKALSCDSVPHFTTIANFVSSYSDQIEQIFEQILLVCHEQGLLGNELFAIDGCKMSSNASKEWSGTLKELTEKRAKIQRQIRHHIKEHKRIDKSESSEYERSQRLKQTIETLNSASEKIDKFLKTAAPRMGKGRVRKEVKSNITDNESAKMTTSKGTLQGYNGVAAVDKKHQIIIEAQAFGEGQEHHTLQPIAQRILQRYQRLGISDNIYATGTVLTADTGFANEANMQYLHEHSINAYVPDNQFRSRDPKFQAHKQKYGKKPAVTGTPWREAKKAAVIPASEFHFDANTMTCICPQGEQLSHRSTQVNANGDTIAYFEGRLLQCRHCPRKQVCMYTPESADHRKGKGRQVSFAVKRALGKTSATPYTDWMKPRVDSDQGKVIYGHRMSVVEPVFGNIGTNKGLNRFSLRGRHKVQGQWQLYCLVHNIEKLINYGKLAA